MRDFHKFLLAVAATLTMAFPAAADSLVFGGDAYHSGVNINLSEPVQRDALLGGFSVTLSGKVEKDAHAMGFDVDVDAPVGQDLYVAGFSVEVAKPVGEDLTASGGTVTIGKDAAIGGNARLFGGTVEIDAPIAGSLLVAAGDLTINGTVAGDVQLAVGKLAFGPDARIMGMLRYSAPAPIDIAASVVAPDRVQFTKTERGSQNETVQQTIDRSMPSFWPSFFSLVLGMIMTVVFLVVVAGVFLYLAPQLIEDLRVLSMDEPAKSIGFGVLGLSMLIGLVPISAMAIIGIPLIPVIALAIVVFWIAGYALGVYALSMRVAAAFMTLNPTLAVRLTVLAAGLCVFAILHFIPFLGWLANLLAVLLGMGGLTRALLKRWMARGKPNAVSVERPPSALV